MIDTKELRRLAQAVIGWGCCNQAWLDQSEDTPAAVVSHINEDGETYPVVAIDCDQYSAAGQSLPLGKFYAAANPAVINELLHRLEAAETTWKVSDKSCYDLTEKVIPNLRDQLETAEKERDALRAELLDARETVRGLFHAAGVANMTITALQARIEAMEKQEPVELNFIELRNSAQKIVESYVYSRRFIANTPLENDIAALMACFVFAQLDVKGE